MRRIAIALAVFALAAGCFGGDDGAAGEELVALATASDQLTYSVAYGFSLSGPLAEAVTTAMEIRQAPPTTYRRFATTTLTDDDERITNTQWFIQRADGDYVCFSGGDDDVTCQSSPTPPAGLFGYAPVDEVFAAARRTDGFASVARADERTVAGEQARCFSTQAHPTEATPGPTPEPRFHVTRYAYEICYTQDGILVYARQEIVVDEGAELSEERRQTVLEARSVSRTVDPADLELPGPVADGS